MIDIADDVTQGLFHLFCELDSELLANLKFVLLKFCASLYSLVQRLGEDVDEHVVYEAALYLTDILEAQLHLKRIGWLDGVPVAQDKIWDLELVADADHKIFCLIQQDFMAFDRRVDS